MTVTFELRADPELVDTPFVNLRDKKFSEVVIHCADGVTYTFVQEGNSTDFISVPCFGDKVITLYSNYFSFERMGATHIISYDAVTRWKLWL